MHTTQNMPLQSTMNSWPGNKMGKQPNVGTADGAVLCSWLRNRRCIGLDNKVVDKINEAPIDFTHVEGQLRDSGFTVDRRQSSHRCVRGEPN